MKTVVISALALLASMPVAFASDVPATPAPHTITLKFNDQDMQILSALIQRAGHGCNGSDDGKTDCQMGIMVGTLQKDLQAQLSAPGK